MSLCTVSVETAKRNGFVWRLCTIFTLQDAYLVPSKSFHLPQMYCRCEGGEYVLTLCGRMRGLPQYPILPVDSGRKHFFCLLLNTPGSQLCSYSAPAEGRIVEMADQKTLKMEMNPGEKIADDPMESDTAGEGTKSAQDDLNAMHRMGKKQQLVVCRPCWTCFWTTH